MSNLSPIGLREIADKKLDKQVEEFIKKTVYPSLESSAEKGYTGWQMRMNGQDHDEDTQIMFKHPDFLKVLKSKLDEGFAITIEKREPMLSMLSKNRYLIIKW